MNYLKDTTRLSVLVVAFLLVGSAFAFLPAFAATGGARTNTANPDCATPCVNNSSPPTVGGYPYVIQGGVTVDTAPYTSVTGATTFGVNVTNPASNAFAITSITIIAPAASVGFSFAGTPTCGTTTTTGNNELLDNVGAYSSSAVQCTSGTGAGLPPGFSTIIHLGALIGPAVADSATPTQGTFTSLVVDSSGTGESYAGGSFVEYSIAPATITAVDLSISPATTYTAGGAAITVTADLSSGEVGVPLVFSFPSSYSPVSAYGRTFTSTLSPSSTLSSGATTTTTWTPSDYALEPATGITAAIGNAVYTDSSDLSALITTVPATPSEVSFYFTISGTTYGTDYLTLHTEVSTTYYAEAGTEISFSLADAYSNPVAFSTAVTGVSLVSSGGDLLAGTTLDASLSCGTAATTFKCPTSGTSLAFPLTSGTGVADYVNYVQGSLYGTTSTVSATITTSTGSYTGTSGSIITSTLDPTLAAPAVFNETLNAQTPLTTHCGDVCGDGVVQAGNQIYVVQTLTPIAQEGVPITLNFCPACSGTSAGYDGGISGFIVSETLYTNSSGIVQEKEPANITIGATAQFNDTMAAPETTDTTNTIAGSGLSIAMLTTVGSIATLKINVAANTSPLTGPNVKYSAPSATNYVAIAYADSYGNLIPVADAPAVQTQIALSATSGALLSATNVYIGANTVATNISVTGPPAGTAFGEIELTMPSTVGTTVTLTATGVVSGVSVVGTASLTTVSDSPTISVTSPLPIKTTIYSSALETIFKGTANASIGLPSTDIVSIGYQVGTGTWESVATAALHNVTWSIPIILTEGLNTVTFNATDNESPAVTTVSSPFTVLVDTTTPTFSAMKVASSGATVDLNVTSAEGDLNASSVVAWYNGTAIPSSAITVTGTNNPGSSVVYSVAINPPVIGTWSLEVSATSLAGLTGTTTATITTTSTTVVPPSTTFSFPAPTSCTIGTYNAVCVSLSNSQTTSETGVVFAVLHNAAGATIEVATSTVTVAGLGSQVGYVVVNVPAGTYSVNVFVWSTTGAAISAPQTVSITVA